MRIIIEIDDDRRTAAVVHADQTGAVPGRATATDRPDLDAGLAVPVATADPSSTAEPADRVPAESAGAAAIDT